MAVQTLFNNNCFSSWASFISEEMPVDALEMSGFPQISLASLPWWAIYLIHTKPFCANIYGRSVILRLQALIGFPLPVHLVAAVSSLGQCNLPSSLGKQNTRLGPQAQCILGAAHKIFLEQLSWGQWQVLAFHSCAVVFSQGLTISTQTWPQTT